VVIASATAANRNPKPIALPLALRERCDDIPTSAYFATDSGYSMTLIEAPDKAPRKT